jgi:hypothetical protein
VARLKRLALALALFAAGAAAAGDDAFWYVQHDNDIFLESDRWYTSGLRLAFTRALDANRRIELGLVQEIYTPEAKRVRFNDVQRDRQYAGRLFVSAARHDSADGFLRTIEATAGVRGPAALAEQSQHGIHRFVPAPETDWSHQLPNQLDAAIGGVHTHELAIPRMAGPQRMAVHYGAVAGNMLTFAHAGFELRTDGARAVPSPALRFAATPPVARERADGWTAFVGASARAVLRNALLSDNVIIGGPALEHRRMVARFAAGATWTHRWGIVTFSAVQDTREFEGQRSNHRFGILTFRLDLF